ncbi:methyltransferase domain-containing protein [Hyphobacterium marinum]|uniref:Methyltransferase domain-containing protein n=1 Tax=Hyphobacterium marinum TaxID=3116574 RepID=A0ABU7LYH9_9PROT|nr:methyltransferase domain-containing protein [Hyphobacterium sp. Y6023]MEE2566245.1 methyltransferase domain-containing protein [Hyphobacterium sp. Y6023]
MPSDTPPRLFDRALLRRRRDRAAASLPDCGFLVERAAEDLLDRLLPVVRDFPLALALGGGGSIGRALAYQTDAAAKIGTLIETDLSPRHAAGGGMTLAMDEEAFAVADESLDLVVSPLALHWTNDLPGTLIQINRALKPDGFFAAALIGGASLTELRQSLMAAEAELFDGVNARVSPFADAQDLSALLQRAGFALPVADVDRMTVRYDTMFDLMRDLRGMGETSALVSRPRKPATKALFLRAAEIYAERFSDADGRIRATFEIIHAAGWAPHPGQPKPKRPGSATVRLADALGVREQSAGEKAGG